jgi:hypothetical protein
MSIDLYDVYVVYGDGVNVGSSLLGVFSTETQAIKCAQGRGNLDTGTGDGYVEKHKCIKDGDKIYLLALDFPIDCDKILVPDPRKMQTSYKILIKNVDPSKAIDFLKVFRKRTGMSLKESKDFLDYVRAEGVAEIPSNSTNLNAWYDEKDVLDWKQELELNGIATVEAK